jgi:hypothetical protein
MSHTAVTQANHRLVRKGFLKPIKQATAELARVWELIPSVASPSISSPEGKCEEVAMYAPLGAGVHDAFAWSGLGATAAQIWDLLQTGGDYTVAEFAEKTGRNKTTILRNLERMNRLHMVQVGPELRGRAIPWRAAPNVDLNQIAVLLHTMGTNAARKAKHRIEREVHLARLMRYREAQGKKPQ